MKKKWFSLLLSTVCAAGLVTPWNTHLPTAEASSSSNWVPIWSDDFNGPNGSGVDTSKWNLETGNNNGWGNNELEYYTNRTNNSYMENGNLVIQALKENYQGSQYTSARLTTANKFNVKYGKIDIRAKVPYGKGIWPAAWMLGSDIGSNPWPASGEIDVMEYIGPPAPNTVYGTIHGPGYSGDKGLSAGYTIGEPFSNAFHNYTVEWEPGVIRWYVDGKLYHTRTPADVGDNTWAYDKPFFLLLNLAVGGNWPGYPDASTAFPQKLLVDYVHVFQREGGYNIVALKAGANGKYVTAEDYGRGALIARSDNVSTWERFELVDLGSNRVALRSMINGKYVSADNNGTSPLIANKTSIGTWETFELGTTADGKRTLKSLANNNYVTADNTGSSPLIANRASVGGAWEAFEVVKQ
ncbi:MULTISPECIES: family 16 glycosylhydrolase [Paenibacillus]|uniref:family 16 glycosylhydrolase n=1 Tax=Paenibacillus TaxID=44249 RepID=UPI0003652B7D|nr:MULTISPECIES: family 16 glycosylhydrolase [Paenibacillus]